MISFLAAVFVSLRSILIVEFIYFQLSPEFILCCVIKILFFFSFSYDFKNIFTIASCFFFLILQLCLCLSGQY